ncbi:MAG TPA: AAA family ATPase, partial [Thiotrichales bacterium]|nr:AAA family ATPase [Thiotrichales bacterium]
TPEMEQALMSVLLARCQSEMVMNVSAEALALCCDYASRLAEDATRLALRMDQLEALLLRAQDEAIHLGHELIDVPALTLAMHNDRYEAGRLEAEYRQAITAGWLSIATKGEAVGQVNALTVYEVGRMAFGQPVKISAQTSPGNDGLVDIEKEVDLAGPIHSKGMLIVQGYLRGRFMRSRSMALTASVVMEQTYEGVEGDSASAAETLALLSSIAQIPLRQDIAVTGAINQFGDVQAVGGINEKIEGFFRLCAMRGLTGSQGVLIPVVNCQSLMLAEDVRRACEVGQFHVYPVAH